MSTTLHTEIVNDLLKLAVESGASDIIIKSEKPGYLRLGGRLRAVEMDPISCDHAQAFVDEKVPRIFKDKWDKDGQVDHAVGVLVHRKRGDRVQAGEPLATLHARHQPDLAAMAACFEIGDQPAEPEPLMLGQIGA